MQGCYYIGASIFRDLCIERPVKASLLLLWDQDIFSEQICVHAGSPNVQMNSVIQTKQKDLSLTSHFRNSCYLAQLTGCGVRLLQVSEGTLAF